MSYKADALTTIPIYSSSARGGHDVCSYCIWDVGNAQALNMTDARDISNNSNPYVRSWVGFDPMISELQGKPTGARQQESTNSACNYWIWDV